MPLYEYRCTVCASITAAERTIKEDEQIPPCKDCGAPTTRIYGVGAVTFKGNGWGKQAR